MDTIVRMLLVALVLAFCSGAVAAQAALTAVIVLVTVSMTVFGNDEMTERRPAVAAA